MVLVSLIYFFYFMFEILSIEHQKIYNEFEYWVVITCTLLQATIGLFVFVSLMHEFPSKNAYEWKKSKLWICSFFILTILTVCLLILEIIGDHMFLAVENHNVKINLFLYFLLEILKLNRCFICFVIINMKSSDDIFQGISKLE